VPFEWTPERQKAFKAIKAKLVMIPVVAYSNFNKSFILYIDALNGDIGAILYQKGNNERERIIAYTSKTFNEHKKKYLIIE